MGRLIVGADGYWRIWERDGAVETTHKGTHKLTQHYKHTGIPRFRALLQGKIHTPAYLHYNG
jgi:hypothetical protein